MVGILYPAHRTPELVTHTNLQYLLVCGIFLGNYDTDLALINNITLPNLRLVEVCRVEMWPHEKFKAFLMWSKCPSESPIFGMAVFLTDQQRLEYDTLLPSLELITGPVRDTFSKSYQSTIAS